MWLFYSLLSAVLTGCVPILAAKPSRAIGAEKSAVTRAAFVLIGAGILVLMSKSSFSMSDWLIWLIFALAGLFDAAAWLFFYRAIAGGTTETAVIREKSCVPISILLTALLSLSLPTFTEWAAIALFAIGILYSTRGSHMFLPYLSAVCTAAQMQLSKIGIERIGSQKCALFLRSVFSLLFLLILSQKIFVNTGKHNSQSISLLKSALLVSLSGICAFFAWSFCFSALTVASAAKVQAITKLNFWVTGLYLSIRGRGINRRHWFGYACMTIGALIMIA